MILFFAFNFAGMKTSARDRILLTAHDLFYRDGIRATGIDKIIAASGVAKVTFYRHFPSKNDLIFAFLEYRHQRWIAWFSDALKRHGGHSGGGLSPLIPALTEWFGDPVFRGCAFINSVAELGELDEVVEISKRHKLDMATVIADLLPPSGEQANIAQAISMAVDGAIVKAQLEIKNDKECTALDSLSILIEAFNGERSK